MQFIRESDPQLGPHADLFRKHVSVSAGGWAGGQTCDGDTWVIMRRHHGASERQNFVPTRQKHAHHSHSYRVWALGPQRRGKDPGARLKLWAPLP